MAVHPTVRFSAPRPPQAQTTTQGTVLLIEDDAPLARGLIRVMNAEGYEVVHVGSGAAAVEKVKHRAFDAVISDLNLPGASGVDVLNVVRAYDPEVPFVLMTGSPTVGTAIEAVSLGVLEYLVKPTPREQIVRVLDRVSQARRSALERRQALAEADIAAGNAVTVRPPAAVSTVHDALAMVNANVTEAEPADTTESGPAALERAMSTLAVELDPIADGVTKRLIGFAARMSSTEDSLTTEPSLVVAAERMGRLKELRRRVRDLAVNAFAAAPQGALLFVDVHPSELMEGDLYSPEPALARIAERVVLQVRAHSLTMVDLSARASVLRFVGFRIAVADVDADRPCLSQIADLSPEFVKLDARLVRGLNGSAGRRRVVTALVSMSRSLDAVAIAEGVSTAEDCDALLEAGCAVVQGPIARRHALLRGQT